MGRQTGHGGEPWRLWDAAGTRAPLHPALPPSLAMQHARQVERARRAEGRRRAVAHRRRVSLRRPG
ncbi:MAG: hypothetical protein ACLGIR_10495 [Actinomycetes bacterium]